jgi:hypothetical protein
MGHMTFILLILVNPLINYENSSTEFRIHVCVRDGHSNDYDKLQVVYLFSCSKVISDRQWQVSNYNLISNPIKMLFESWFPMLDKLQFFLLIYPIIFYY